MKVAFFFQVGKLDYESAGTPFILESGLLGGGLNLNHYLDDNILVL
jgi:hypothetical protein